MLTVSGIMDAAALLRDMQGAIDPAAILETLLDRLLHNPEESKPSPKSAAAALTLCESLANHLRSLVSDEPGHPKASPSMMPTDTDIHGFGSGLMTAAPESSAPVAAGAPVEGASGEGRRPSRPSQKQRQKLRRQQEAQQAHAEQAHAEQAQVEQAQAAGAPTHYEYMAMLQAQQQQFQQSPWSGGWQMVPFPPNVPLSQMVFAPTPLDFHQSSWGVGWQMVPHPPLFSAHAAAAPARAPQHVRAPSPPRSPSAKRCPPCAAFPARVPPTPPVPPKPVEPVASDATLKERVTRCMKAYRWRRMQGVWTHWMRDEWLRNSAAAAATAKGTTSWDAAKARDSSTSNSES